jgi:hypothetical protein
MSKATSSLLALLLLSAGLARAEAPALVLRARPLDGLISDMRRLFQLAGREDEGNELEKLMQSRTGPKGLEGVDTKKPFGLTAELHPRLTESKVWLLLPVSDEKVFLKFLESVDMKARLAKDGCYTLEIEGLPAFNTAVLRFAHGYMYATLKLSDSATIPPADKLPKPEDLLGKSDAALSLSVHGPGIPEPTRKLLVSFLGLQLGAAKDDAPKDESPAQKVAREAALDEMAARVKSLLEEGETLRLELHLTRGKEEELALTASLSGKKGASLARDIAALGKLEGVLPGGKDAVMSGSAHLALPERLRKPFDGLVEEAVKSALDMLQAHEREVLEPLVKSVSPTFRAGMFDGGMYLTGPGKGGKYAFVAGARIQGGVKIEEAIRAALKVTPGMGKKDITLDAARAGDVKIHAIRQRETDEATRDLLGDGPMYLALRDDAALIALGEGGLEALKKAITAKPAPAPVLHLEASLEKLAPLLAKQEGLKGAEAVAKEAFKGGGGQVRLLVTGGERLEARLSVQAAALKFASLLERQGKGK